MFVPRISRRVRPNAQRATSCFTDHRLVHHTLSSGGSPITDCLVHPKRRDPESIRGFTLLELLIVVGIVALLMVLIAPAFTSIKGGTDVTSAAYTIKGALDTARTYAKANNTYTWVGFLEENVANPASPNSDTPRVGRLVMSIVASKNGTTVYDPNNLATIDATQPIQVGKLTKVQNIHLWTHTDTQTARAQRLVLGQM